MTPATSGTQVRADLIETGDFVRFSSGISGLHDRYRDRWWKVTEVDDRYGAVEPVLRLTDADGHTDMVHANRYLDVIAHDYTLRQIRNRENGT